MNIRHGVALQGSVRLQVPVPGASQLRRFAPGCFQAGQPIDGSEFIIPDAQALREDLEASGMMAGDAPNACCGAFSDEGD